MTSAKRILQVAFAISGQHYDVALRDVGLALAAASLAVLGRRDPSPGRRLA